MKEFGWSITLHLTLELRGFSIFFYTDATSHWNTHFKHVQFRMASYPYADSQPLNVICNTLYIHNKKATHCLQLLNFPQLKREKKMLFWFTSASRFSPARDACEGTWCRRTTACSLSRQIMPPTQDGSTSYLIGIWDNLVPFLCSVGSVGSGIVHFNLWDGQIQITMCCLLQNNLSIQYLANLLDDPNIHQKLVSN